MKQAVRKTVTKTLTNKIEERLFWAFLGLFLVMLGLYFYFISASIVNVLIREEAEIDIARVGSGLSTIETAYLAKKNIIDADYAQTLGFHLDAKAYFVTHTTRGLTINQ
ncbi:MAG: hypothetical protein WDZ90_02095 [Candidatus Paceibacterota bacterium]